MGITTGSRTNLRDEESGSSATVSEGWGSRVNAGNNFHNDTSHTIAKMDASGRYGIAAVPFDFIDGLFLFPKNIPNIIKFWGLGIFSSPIVPGIAISPKYTTSFLKPTIRK